MQKSAQVSCPVMAPVAVTTAASTPSIKYMVSVNGRAVVGSLMKKPPARGPRRRAIRVAAKIISGASATLAKSRSMARTVRSSDLMYQRKIIRESLSAEIITPDGQ